MKIKVIPLVVLALILALTLFGSAGKGSDVAAEAEDESQLIVGTSAVLRYDPTPNAYKVPLPPSVLDQARDAASPDTLSIIVIYNPAASCPSSHPKYPGSTRQPWPVDAEIAMDMAALIWSSLLNGTQPVIVHACWYSTLAPNLLGEAVPTNAPQNFPNAPQSNTLYPVALANQLANSDLNGTTPEIGASFSASFTWYFGLDGNIPLDAAGNPTALDFLSSALHEIGHGLGYFGGATWDNGTGSAECNGMAGNGCVTNPPFAYDTFVRSGTTNIVGGFTNPSLALGNALITNTLNFNGPNAISANGGNAPLLFAPNPWQPGASYLHLDEATFDNTVNALMTPALAAGEVLHYPGPVGLGVLADLGWQVNGFFNVAVDKSNTGFEDGSFDHPYNTVQEGVAAVRDDGLVFITAGNYNERVTIVRPMTLLASGGTVKIGE
jgi:hypothetical protein